MYNMPLNKIKDGISQATESGKDILTSIKNNSTALICSLGLTFVWYNAQGQEVYKRITDTPNGKKIELYAAANTWLVGPKTFNVGSSYANWPQAYYNDITGDVFDGAFNQSFFTNPLSSETIGNNTINYDSYENHVTTGLRKDNATNNVLEITTTGSNRNGTVGTWSGINVFKTEFLIPNTLNNGDPLPNWSRARLSSRFWTIANSNEEPLSARDLWFQYIDGERVFQNTLPDGTPTVPTPDVETLSTIDFSKDYEVALRPSPANDIIHINNGNELNGETLQKVRIYDMMGRQVYTGYDVIEGQAINISHLAKGIYTLQVEGDHGTPMTKKFAKN